MPAHCTSTGMPTPILESDDTNSEVCSVPKALSADRAPNKLTGLTRKHGEVENRLRIRKVDTLHILADHAKLRLASWLA